MLVVLRTCSRNNATRMQVLSSAPPTDSPSPTTSGRRVELQNVTRSFTNSIRAVDDVSLVIPAGQFVALLGPSGCGKSTLLRMIAGLDRPDAGTINVGGSTEARRSDIAFVFQDAHLLPWRSVLRNVALPLELRGESRSTRLARATDALRSVGLGDALRRYPAQLSGGMRMRVSLARALVTDPKLLLLDEPFAALDEITRQALDEQLRTLWQRRGMTVVFVTHSTAEASFLADRAVVFSRRPARVVLDVPIDLPPDRPATVRTSVAFAHTQQQLFDALAGGGP